MTTYCQLFICAIILQLTEDNNAMKTKIHVLGAFIATLCIATFFTSTIIVELFGSYECIARIKELIVMPGLFILIPAIAVTGGSGFSLGRSRKGSL